jgi:hypothetical protein
MSPKKETQESAKSSIAINKKSRGFTNEERAAVKARAQELKAEARANKNKADDLAQKVEDYALMLHSHCISE